MFIVKFAYVLHCQRSSHIRAVPKWISRGIMSFSIQSFSEMVLYQRYATEEPIKVQGRDRVGIVEGFCGYRTRGISIRGKFVLSSNRGRHVAKCSSNP